MKTIASTDLTAESLAMLDGAGPAGVVITQAGKPVARLVAIKPTRKVGIGHLIGSMKGKVGIKGDIFSTGVQYDADSGYTYPPVRPKRRAQAKRSKTRK